ncbi:aminotransferase class V [candidate division MSBL1 archaeon SCGC-AAA382C18]|uniref:Aminotransferase class V n=1 Tax=candidate division MSBL1 archaeon SCGC-AAA382C18 TaxID=1698281 RepID=A0A133VKT0_9EURY|nr:aminotransferase class V [candidate division MSBL1 archaeon SCGC-AAA382C18]
MTPGPTEVSSRVRNAMSLPIQNPDIDEEFFDFYHDLEEKIQKIYQTVDDVIILGGEGILGLEASVASTVEKNDKVLCLSNGIYGDGFANFVENQGGDPVLCEFSYDKILSPEKVKTFVEEDSFKAATMVHCETPTGTLNNLREILSILKDAGILTIVDAVSSLGGTRVPTEEMDICIGGSQKCFSAPPGLTTLSVSEEAWDVIMEKDQNTHYTNLALWKEMWFGEEYFPYTHSVSNIYALSEAIDIILEEGLEKVFKRHEKCAEKCRESTKNLDLELYPKKESYCSPTVTALHLGGMAKDLQKRIREMHDILLATSLGDFENDILRIGHMGHNATIEKVERTMNALRDVLNNTEI